MATLAINGGAPVRTRPWPRWPQWDAREEQRVLDVLRSDDWGGFAPVVAEFERAFAKRHDAAFGIAAVNGTQTLVAALMAAGIGPGDEVIVPPHTFIATASAMRDERPFGAPRNLFEQALEAEGIPCSTGYPFPLYRQESLGPAVARAGACPNAEQACREAIWLPQWLLLAEPDEMDDVAAAIIKIRDHRDELRYVASS